MIEMKRGDLVTVAIQGDYGKPRPALVVQSDLIETLSVVVLPLTSDLRNYGFLRVRVEPEPANGLTKTSQVMIDKITAIARARVGAVIGRISDEQMKEVERGLRIFLAIA